MSLEAVLASFKDARAERVLFAPGEVALAFNDGESRALGREPWARSVLFEAVSELLSQDEIRELPNNRPRIVRHEYDGVDYVIELARQGGGIALGVRLGRGTLRRDPMVGASRESFRAQVRPAESAVPREPVAPVAPVAQPNEALTKSPSKRFRALRDRRTVRVELDDEGNAIDPMAFEAAVPMAEEAPKPPPKRPSKPVRRPSLSNARATKPAHAIAAAAAAAAALPPPAAAAAAATPASRPSSPPAAPTEELLYEELVYETRIIPRAGRPTTEADIAGGTSGTHVTFLFAPGGYALVSEEDGSVVVVGASDQVSIGGDLFVAPSMKLRINQGPRESIVTFFRRTWAR